MLEQKGFLITGVRSIKGVGRKTLSDAIIYYICLTILIMVVSKYILMNFRRIDI
jgi:endonuclease III-like uncharacterized protein